MPKLKYQKFCLYEPCDDSVNLSCKLFNLCDCTYNNTYWNGSACGKLNYFWFSKKLIIIYQKQMKVNAVSYGINCQNLFKCDQTKNLVCDLISNRCM